MLIIKHQPTYSTFLVSAGFLREQQQRNVSKVSEYQLVPTYCQGLGSQKLLLKYAVTCNCESHPTTKSRKAAESGASLVRFCHYLLELACRKVRKYSFR